jgi:nicotinamidase/pyrazinamidase
MITTSQTVIPNRSRVASFDVDAQRTFTPLCPQELPVPNGDEIAAELNAQASFASLRLGSKDAHSPKALWIANASKPSLSRIESEHVLENLDVYWPAHAIIGTEGFELLATLPRPIDYDYFVWKGIELDLHPYGACYHDLANTKTTGVIEYLQSRQIQCVIVGGLALDYCVATTATQLKLAGFDVVINLAATRGISVETCAKAKETLAAIGVRFVRQASDLTDSSTEN